VRFRFSSLKGMEVLAEKEGKLLGSVKRLQIDSRHKTALGLVFKARGLAKERWAKVADILRVGEDVVFLDAKKSQHEDAPAGRDVRDMLGLPVTSLDGKRLGALDDVVVDTDDWDVVALALDNGGEVDLTKDAVLGEDTILLQKGAYDQVRRGKAATGGGFLSRVFSPEEPAAAVKKSPPAKKRKPAAGGKKRARRK
jgi:sporulation protein YlmC with PRC-barrel domain